MPNSCWHQVQSLYAVNTLFSLNKTALTSKIDKEPKRNIGKREQKTQVIGQLSFPGGSNGLLTASSG